MILDLSAVTDSLIDLVKDNWAAAPIWAELGLGSPAFTPTFSGLAPDAIRDGGGSQLSLFLYHVESDNAQESTFWTSQMVRSPGQPVRYLPLALDLYYLLSAYSDGSYAEEQQAMSVAMRIYHANAAVRSDTTPTPAWSLTLTMEHRSYDELSRLWQATTASLRLSAVYRAAVVFLTPDEPSAAAKEVQTVEATVNDSDVVTVIAP
jgi:hypothetical protein